MGLVWLYTTIYPPRPRFFTSSVESLGCKKNLGLGGYIVVYSPPRPNVYITYILYILGLVRLYTTIWPPRPRFSRPLSDPSSGTPCPRGYIVVYSPPRPNIYITYKALSVAKLTGLVNDSKLLGLLSICIYIYIYIIYNI